VAPEERVDERPDALAQGLGDLGGERHLKACIRHRPRHLIERVVLVEDGVRIDQSEPARARFPGLARDESGGGPVREQAVGDEVVHRQIVLEVNRAELDADDEHDRLGLRAADGAGGAQTVERPVAAHEADDLSLHVRAQAELLDEHDVQTRGEEARTRDDDEVRDRLTADVWRPGHALLDRRAGERRRLAAVELHPGGRRG
jgi:hypothetical protein